MSAATIFITSEMNHRRIIYYRSHMISNLSYSSSQRPWIVEVILNNTHNEWFLCLRQELKKMKASSSTINMNNDLRRNSRNLSGPGSSPPRCYAKCGKCTPCRPVHVAVPPGTPVTAEYYPEAWRCKCGNKLYMPWILFISILIIIWAFIIYSLATNTYTF